jgi:hypothetical protein
MSLVKSPLVLPRPARSVMAAALAAFALASTSTAQTPPGSAARTGTDSAPRRAKAASATGGAKASPGPATKRTGSRSASDSAIDALWPVRGPAPLPGSILPKRRIVAYYGNPLSKRMGILGELPPDQMLARLDREVAAWNKADPSLPVQPALHLIATVAQGSAGKDGKWRYRVHPELIEKVYGWAKQKNALLFLDVQIGKSTLEEELAVLAPYLQRPDVHLGIDPEFAMTKGGDPGRRVGTYDARHINQAIDYLADLVTKHRLPPKVFVVHRFTGPMVTNSQNIKLDPRVQVVMHMDGWGPPYGKRATWARYIRPYPVQYTGFKLFYHNDTKAGHPLMKPADVLALHPDPVYIQYQ